ncbi:hypothetical protein HP550_14465 [Cellulomonas humilata]|uniref:Nucleotide exchange factor GrpE n=1 Tax=Cellulomonas humilata TaxID=144055 RepID=A0A7Y6DYV7_9CELL|nr:hypothetical protein [Cellulomonas humilata]NUU18457.1 hypothetical protein [Cellulomonas humilata]
MSRQRVMLELDEERHVLRTGELVSAPGSPPEVRWSDGTVQTMRDSRRRGYHYVTPVLGGLEHRLLVDPDGARALFQSVPVEAFLLALRDATEPQLSKDLIAGWERAFDRTEVAAAWRKAKVPFEDLPEVRVRGADRARRYLWVGEDEMQRPPAEQTPSVAPADVVADVTLETEIDTAHDVATLATAPVALPARNLVRDFKALARGKGADLPVDELDAQVRTAPPAVQALYGALSASEWRTALGRALATPLKSAISMAEFGDEVLASALDRSQGALGLLFLALPRSSKAVPDAGLDPEGIVAVVGRAIEEHRVHRSSADAKPLAAALGFLLDRVLAEPIASRLAPSTVLSTAAAADRLRPQKEDHEASVGALNASIVTLGRDGWARLPAADKASIARRAARGALAPGTARVRLMTTVWRFEPDQIRDAAWWERVTFDDLVAIASSSTRSILTDPAIRSSVVDPRTRRALDDASTRRRLMTVLAAPGEIAPALGADHVREAITRVAADDDLTREWLGEIRDDRGKAALEHRLDAAVQEAHTLTSSVAEAQATTAAATDRLQRAEQRLRDASDTTDALRDSQSRQIRVDAMRALADMASYVGSALERQSAERIGGRVAAIAAREGLTRLGEPGEHVPYKPSEHDLVGSPAEPGTAVVVRHVGYTWDGPDGEIVLARALVERAT